MYKSYIGLEIHIRLLTESKVFCGCRAAFGEEPNTNICPVCMGLPGVLPALNKEAIKMSYRVASAINCRISDSAIFERKNYFYPDMPKNYQISQFESPLGRDGFIDMEFEKGKIRVQIREVHLEEDAGKMIHAGDISLLDYNRAGTPLLEIVTMPDLETGEQAEIFIQNFRRLVRYLGVCDGNMEEGSLRCDANVSVNIEGRGLGSKVEIKNLNSSRFVRKALNYEISRQKDVLEQGGSVIQETRLWNENRDITEGMRTKESSFDYRYFPEPDLPPFRPDPVFLESVESALVELPETRKKRFLKDYKINERQADFLCEEKEIADFYENTVGLGADCNTAALWMASDVQKQLNRRDINLSESCLTSERFAILLKLISKKRIHGRIAKQVLEVIFDEDKSPEQIIEERNWEQISDRSKLEALIVEAVKKHSAAVDQIQAGDRKPIGFLIGEVMKQSSGRAEPGAVKEILEQILRSMEQADENITLKG